MLHRDARGDTFALANAACAAMLPDDPTGKTLEEVFSRGQFDTARLRQEYAETMRTGQPIVRSGIPWTMRDGSAKRMNAVVSRWSDPDGSPRGVVIVSNDVTTQLEVTEKYRSLFGSIDQGFVSASWRGTRAVFAEHVVKPFEVDSLCALIARLAGQKRRAAVTPALAPRPPTARPQ